MSLSCALASCAVGPDFIAPAPPDVERFTAGPTASPGGGQRFREGAEIPARWWEAFGSQRLDDLVDEALARSPTLEAADAAIRATQFNAFAGSGAFFPQVSLGSNSSYNLSSGDATNSTVLQTPFSFFTKQVQISYTLDIWGAAARNVESLDALRDQQIYLKQAAHLTLAANVVKAAIEEASLRGQIAATRRVIALEEERLALLRRQLEYGGVAGTDILSQQTALEQARQTLPPLESRLAQQRNLLTALAGRYPSEEVDATFALAQFSPPRDLPLSLPSRLVAQRPDIKGAEANLHSASALIGVAVAARLPNITLSANGSTSAFALAQLFQPGTFGYALAGNIAQTAFDGMILYNKQKAAEASFDQAKAQYRDTVVRAFQNVADALRALQSDARSLQSTRGAERTTKKYLESVRLRLEVGSVSQLAVVDAQRAYLAAALSRIQSEAQRLTDTAALFVALGGGW
ncbi:MAG TPA: efflux transporter outer membrane subunit [Methylocystis sp.]|nr:efflux transporter outer membrane subunit [Methylocystis sp.]